MPRTSQSSKSAWLLTISYADEESLLVASYGDLMGRVYDTRKPRALRFKHSFAQYYNFAHKHKI